MFIKSNFIHFKHGKLKNINLLICLIIYMNTTFKILKKILLLAQYY